VGPCRHAVGPDEPEVQHPVVDPGTSRSRSRSTAVADAAYNQGYNPGYTGPPLTSLLPKGYVPKSGLSPTDKGQVAAETGRGHAGGEGADVRQVGGADEQGHHPVHEHRRPDQAAEERVEVRRLAADAELVHQVWKQTYQDTFCVHGQAGVGEADRRDPRAVAVDLHALQQLATDKVTSTSRRFGSSTPRGWCSTRKAFSVNNWKPSGGIIRQAIAQNWDQATF
jgi:hypothetical protein